MCVRDRERKRVGVSVHACVCVYVFACLFSSACILLFVCRVSSDYTNCKNKKTKLMLLSVQFLSSLELGC